MNCLFKKPGGFFVMLLLVMSAHAAFDKHTLQTVVPNLKNSMMSALSEQEQELYRLCKPDPAPCFQIQNKIKSIKKDIQICCDGLEEKIDEIIKTVNTLEFCERQTVIDQDFMNSATPQITQSGVYCLGEDVTGSLVIDADDVIIQMNNHTIAAVGNGIEVAGHSNIAIQGSGTISGGMPNGILMTTCTTVVVQDIIFEGNETGLQFNDVHGVRVDSLTFTGHTTAAMGFVNGTRNGKITCVNMFGNTGAVGINVSSSSNLVFNDCTYTSNSALVHIGYSVANDSRNCNFFNCSVNNIINEDIIPHQFWGFYFDGSSDCYCQESQVTKNQDNVFGASVLDGFIVTNSCEKIIFDSCLVLENTNLNNSSGRGFVIENSDACCVLNCVAKTNTVSGFRVEDSTNCYHANNIAEDNSDGYILVGVGNNIFFGNYANANSTNYNVSTNFAPQFTFNTGTGVFTPVAPRIAPITIWDNVEAV